MEFFIFISILGVILLYFGARKREQEIEWLQEELKTFKRKIDFFQTKFDTLDASRDKKSEALRATPPLLEELKIPEEIIAYPNSEKEMPSAGALTIPIWIYRGIMLAWSIWIAQSLIRWLGWIWKSWNEGGLWKRDPKGEQPPVMPRNN